MLKQTLVEPLEEFQVIEGALPFPVLDALYHMDHHIIDRGGHMGVDPGLAGHAVDGVDLALASMGEVLGHAGHQFPVGLPALPDRCHGSGDGILIPPDEDLILSPL